MARTFDPKDFQGRLDKVFAAADPLRQHTLLRLAEEEERDAAVLQEVRAELVRQVGEADPRVRALDRRIAGAKRFVVLTREAATETTTRPEPPKPEPAGDWVVTGRVIDANDRPVAGALVTLLSDHADLVKRFGETRTGDDGRFEVRRAGKDFQDIFERAPKARVVVTSPDGRLTHTTHEIQPAGDQIHAFDIRLHPEKQGKPTRKKG